MSSRASLDDLLRWEKTPTDETKARCVVRVKTSFWYDHNGLHLKKDLNFLRRKCQGDHIIHEDVQMIGADEVIERITNLFEVKDGVYEIGICNERGDWETPHIIEDYDYILYPYVE